MIFTEDRGSFDIIKRTEVTSTQDFAKEELLAKNSNLPFVVVADHQTDGRGRYDRVWQNGEGNLYCTFVLPLSNFPFEKTSLIPLFFGIVLQGAFEAVGTTAVIKWPNDIVVNDKKISGMLLEKTSVEDAEFILAGIGVNIDNFPLDVPYSATSLRHEGIVLDASAFLTQIIENLTRKLSYPMGDEQLIRLWKKNAKGMGKEITVNLSDKTLKGQFNDIDLNGNLVLHTENGVEIISAGDVFFGNE